MLLSSFLVRPGILALAATPVVAAVGWLSWQGNPNPRFAQAETGPSGVQKVPAPSDGKMYTRPELERHFPELMHDFNRLAQRVPMDWDGLPDFKTLADRMPGELTRLAGELSKKSREQFRALIHVRVKTLNALERAFGGEEVAEKLLSALDAADAGDATPM